MKDIVLLLMGGLIAALVTTSVEYLRRPHLALSIHPAVSIPTAFAPDGLRSLRVAVTNKPLPLWLSWMLREPALQCRGAVIFRHLENQQDIFGRPMDARWANTPLPVPIPVVGPEGQNFHIVDAARLASGSRIDIYPGETELLDIAVRIGSDDDGYGWNNEAYFEPSVNGRNPRWRLAYRQCLVEVIVTSSGQTRSGVFLLVNHANLKDFRLEPFPTRNNHKPARDLLISTPSV